MPERQLAESQVDETAIMSPNGRHDEEPEPDFLEQFAEQSGGPMAGQRANALMVLARNKGNLRVTSKETGVTYRQLQAWRDDSLRERGVAVPLEMSESSSAKEVRRQLGVTVNSILKNLPRRLGTATVEDQVKIVKAFVPLINEIDEAMQNRKQLTAAQIQKLAKKKLTEKKDAAGSE